MNKMAIETIIDGLRRKVLAEASMPASYNPRLESNSESRRDIPINYGGSNDPIGIPVRVKKQKGEYQNV